MPAAPISSRSEMRTSPEKVSFTLSWISRKPSSTTTACGSEHADEIAARSIVRDVDAHRFSISR